MQIGREVQGIESHRQRRVVDRLRHLHVTPAQGDLTLRQPLFGGVPAHVGITAKHAAGLGRFRHKRLEHRQVETVEVHHRAPARAGVDGLRYAQLGVRVSPAVRPDADFLLEVAVIQRDIPRQRHRPHRGLETGIAQRTFPALRFAVKAPRQRELPGDRVALHPQLQVVLFLIALRIELHQTDIHARLANTVYAYVKVTANLVGGFHIALHVHLSHRQLLPAQRPGGDIRQQLRRVDGAANLHQPFRRAAQARQGVIEMRCVNGGVEVKVFDPQLAFHVGAVRA